jgi:signal transduction histidine kinase
VAVLAGLLIAAGYRLRFRQLNKRFDLILAERSRIARELHDTLLQGLSGITMQLQALRLRLPASREKQFLGEIIQDAGRCSAEARQSLWGLRAIGSGRSMEFSDKLARLARQTVEGKSISLALKLQPVSLSSRPQLEYQLLRIAQETISNTLSHAHAKNLDIRLSIRDAHLELTFEDNGIGFDRTSAAQPFGHFGLVGMHERADEIGADLTIDSLPGRGTTVSVRVPLSEPEILDSKPRVGLEHQMK